MRVQDLPKNKAMNGELLKLIDENKDKLTGLFNVSQMSEEAIIPRYKVQGLSVTKFIDIPHILDQMAKNTAMNITYRKGKLCR